jgi:hypothetical protein
LKVQANEVYISLENNTFDYERVKSAVRKHQDRQRYARQAARASAFVKHVHGKTDPATLEARLAGYFQRQKWTSNDSTQDLKKVYLLVLPMITTANPKTPNRCAIQRVMYKGMAGNMEYEDQSLLKERSRTQNWPGVTQAIFAKFGRGLVATKEFEKNEVIVDYHGQVFTKKTMDEVSAIDGVKREYCL